MSDFIVALGLAMVIEGVAYALFPDALRRMMAQILAQPSTMVRGAGMTLAVAGVFIVWLIRG